MNQHRVVYEKLPLAACAAKVSKAWDFMWRVQVLLLEAFFGVVAVHSLLSLDLHGILHLREIKFLKSNKTVSWGGNTTM